MSDDIPIGVELAAGQAEAGQMRRCAAFRVVEDGHEEIFRLDQGLELLGAARYLQRYLDHEPGMGARPFTENFPDRTAIAAADLDLLASIRMDNTGEVAGLFDMDFDKREFSALNIMDGWMTFAMGDVSAAARRASQGEDLDTDGRYAVLLDMLAGKAITSAGHLSARDISFAEEICEMDGLLNFYMETCFDVDEMFGTHVRTAVGDDALDVYANYDMATGQACDELEVDLHRADGEETSLSYTLNAAEKEVLLRKMDEYCLRQTGQMLEDYSARLMAEDMEPPAQPVM